jgi:hypothetical protein
MDKRRVTRYCLFQALLKLRARAEFKKVVLASHRKSREPDVYGLFLDQLKRPDRN